MLVRNACFLYGYGAGWTDALLWRCVGESSKATVTVPSPDGEITAEVTREMVSFAREEREVTCMCVHWPLGV